MHLEKVEASISCDMEKMMVYSLLEISLWSWDVAQLEEHSSEEKHPKITRNQLMTPMSTMLLL